MSREEAESHRDHSIRWAVITSMISKVGTVLLRLISIPIAIRTLGYEEFGAYVAITMVVAMIDVLHVGIGPAMTQGISRALAKGDREREVTTFSTGVLMSTGLTLVIASIMAVVIWKLPIPVLFGEEFVPYADSMTRAVWIALGIITIELICIICEKARDGYMETRYTNAWGAASNLLAAVGLIVGLRFFPTIEFLVIVISGSIALAKLGNTIHLLIQRPYLFPWISKFRRALVKPLLSDGMRFTVTYGFSCILEYNILAWLAGQLIGPTATATWSILVTVHFSAAGLMQMLTIPMWPALMDAHERNDLAWIRRSAKKITKIALGFGLCFWVGFVTFSPWALPIWAGEDFAMSHLGLTVFATYFVLHLWRLTNQMLVLGMGKTQLCMVTILVEAMLVLGTALWALGNFESLTAMYGAIVVCLLMVSAWVFPVAFWREVGDDAENEAPGLLPTGGSAIH